MKNLVILFILAYIPICESLCFGQQELKNENGIRLSYKIGQKIGSRFDEYCKTTFDIYAVEGTVVNMNEDKAAMVTAILKFEGKACNKIYSNDNNTTGEVIDKIFSLDIWGQSGKQSQYWGNRYVHLLPTEPMTAKGQVEVKQGDKVQEPDFYLTYELIPSAGNQQNKISEGSNTELGAIKSQNPSNNQTQLMVGEWRTTKEAFIYTDGREVVSDEPPQSMLFNDDGTGVYIGSNREFKYVIRGNKIVWILPDGGEYAWDIVKLDGSTFIMKYDYDDKDQTGLASVIKVLARSKK